MREGVFAGMVVSILYTFALMYAWVTESPAVTDAVVFFTIILAITMIISWSIDDEMILKTDGGDGVLIFRSLMVVVQVIFFFMLGFPLIASIRGITELASHRRMTVARKRSIFNLDS